MIALGSPLRAATLHPSRPARPGLLAMLETWAERRRQRRALLDLNEQMLKDIGLSRADAYREGLKPFWQA